MNHRLVDKVALVSGAARGIGLAIARRFVGEGARVILTDLLRSEGESAAHTLGESARFFPHDVTVFTEWLRVVECAEEAFGPVDILVNNAGIVHVANLEDCTESDYRRVLEVNQIGVFFGMKATVPSMRKAGGGSIINVSSVSGLKGSPRTWAYTASKFAVRGMTKVAAIELAEFGIRANSIHPGPFDTPMAASVAGDVAAASLGIPAGRFGDPDEIASIAIALASDEVRFASGAEFVIDGGLSA